MYGRKKNSRCVHHDGVDHPLLLLFAFGRIAAEKAMINLGHAIASEGGQQTDTGRCSIGLTASVEGTRLKET